MGDSFESSYMSGDADVRHRDKRVSRLMAALLAGPAVFIWGLTIFIGFANATSSKPVPAAALPWVLAGMALLGVLFVVLSLTFAVLRSVVTADRLIVKYGLWGPDIPLSSIKSCKVSDVWKPIYGYGIKLHPKGGWAYVPGPGEVIEIEYEEDGKSKNIIVGAEDPRTLSLEINRARQAQRVRIDDDSEAEAQAEAEAEAEAAEEESAHASR